MCRLRRRCPSCRIVACALLAALTGCASTPDHASPTWVAHNATTAAGILRYERLSTDHAGAPRRLSSAEAEWVMARAIAEHEMRRP
jgi:type IV pilus biogenesis protein CpaD/CtpE